MNLASVSRAEADSLLPTYDRHRVLFTRGRGVYLWDANGKRYLDFLSGIGVNALVIVTPPSDERFVHSRTNLSISQICTFMNTSQSWPSN